MDSGTESNSCCITSGDKFRAGDVLLEIETDKAQIDVEAQEDVIMAKIFVWAGLSPGLAFPLCSLTSHHRPTTAPKESQLGAE